MTDIGAEITTFWGTVGYGGGWRGGGEVGYTYLTSFPHDQEEYLISLNISQLMKRENVSRNGLSDSYIFTRERPCAMNECSHCR